jgi:EmrB/QacA subfamily drug resistance transporter
MLPMFLAVVDQTIVATALPAIAGSFGNAEFVAWVMVSYLIAATAAAPVYGRLGDQFGRRRLMLVALTVLIGASLLCAASRNIETLIFARALQGFGGGGLMTLSQALIGETVAPRDRARYQGYLAAVAVSSSTFGPIAGGFLTEHFGWRSIFLINLPVALAAMLLTLRLRNLPGTGVRFRFDFLGLVLFAVFAGSALCLLQILPTFRLQPAAAASLLALTLVSVSLLIWRETKATNPLLSVNLIRNPSVWRSDVLAACHGATLVSLLTFLPIYFRVVHGASAAEIGVLLLPLPAGVGLGSMLTGRIVSRTGRTAATSALGLAVLTLSLVCVAFLSVGLSASQVAWCFGASGLFMGTVMGVVQVTVQVAAGPTLLGTAAATVQFSRSLGAGIGTALVGAVLFAAIEASGADTAEIFERVLRGGVSVLQSMPASQRSVVEQDFSNAFRAVFLTISGFSGLAMFVAWSLPIRRI